MTIKATSIVVHEVSSDEAQEMLGRNGEASMSAAKRRALDTLNGGNAQQSNKTDSGLENHQGAIIPFD